MSKRKKAAALGLVAAVGLASPPARSAIKAVALMLDVLPSPLRPLRSLTRTPRITTTALGGRPVDVYEPGGLSRPPSIVLVHGAATEGKDDPRLKALALALCRTGRKVVVPDLALREQRLDRQDEVRIRRAIAFASGGGSAGVLAFSYGAALSLVALAEAEALQERVDFVATVGTYFDVSHLIQGVTTGTVPFHGREIEWTPHPRAKELLPQQFAAFLGGEGGAAFLEAWRRQDPAGLTGGASAAYALLSNRDPSMVPALEAALPAELKTLLDGISPAEVIHRLKVPVFALHSENDPASPPTESELLVESVRPPVEARLYRVSFLQHVDPTRSVFSNLEEGVRMIRFSTSILRAQEGWPRL